MSTVLERRPRRRPSIVKILFICVLIFLIVEPIVMYRILQHQRELRRDVRQAVELVVSP
jgi:hypothetical protein